MEFAFSLSTGHSGTTTMSLAESYDELGFDAQASPIALTAFVSAHNARPFDCIVGGLDLDVKPV